jgi:hypothetical protein
MRKNLISSLFILLSGVSLFADEVTFDEKELLEQTEKKPYQIGGFVEVRPVMTRLDRNAALYKLNYYNSSAGKTTDEYNASALLNGSLEFKYFSAYAKGSLGGSYDYEGKHGEKTLYEGYGSFTPFENFRFNTGKESVKWGKGYAWNPSAFITRPKNTDDPELDIEGFYIARAEYIKSFDGVLKTFSITPVILPVTDKVNDDYSEKNGPVYAVKSYLLFFDTDIDFIYAYDKLKKSRYGLGFSRNWGSNLEIHGEGAYLSHASMTVLSEAGTPVAKESGTAVYLAGIRYITDIETTIIAEYYHNGTGKGTDVMKNYFASMDNAYDQYRFTGNDSQLKKISGGSGSAALKSNPMRNYAYFRVSQKDPFDILYFTPAVAWIFNVDDHSNSLSPEIAYTGITNLELRLKSSILFGQKYSEFGEKAANSRHELRVRYSF